MKMTLADFCEEMRKDLAAFEADWLERRNARPKTFPLEMDDAGWYEHYLIWMSMQGSDL